MESIIGHRIDYNGVGALRGQQHIPENIDPSTSQPPPPTPQTHTHTPVKAMYIIGRYVCTIPAVVLEHESHFQHLLLINS